MSTMAGVLAAKDIRKNIFRKRRIITSDDERGKKNIQSCRTFYFVLRTNISDIFYALRDKYFEEADTLDKIVKKKIYKKYCKKID